jgi:hypothetical protein
MLVFAVGTMFASGPKVNNNAPATTGVLQTSSSVLINDNIAEDGITILSGSQIKTSNKGASVQIPEVGLIQLDPETNATLDFTKQDVTLNVTKGNAKLLAKDGINGKIITNTGEIVETTKALSKISSDPSAAQNDDDDKKKRIRRGLFIALAVGAAAIIAIIIVAGSNSDNARSSSPVRP